MSALLNQQDKRIKELKGNNNTLKRSRAHFRKVAENLVYLLEKLSRFIGEPQTRELNYYKVIEDTKNYIEQLKQSIKEDSENLQQLYSHLEVEAFGEDIQKQAVKEIDKLKQPQKQVRKEVVEEIREKLKKAHLEIMSFIDLYSYIDNFLCQVEKGIKGGEK